MPGRSGPAPSDPGISCRRRTRCRRRWSGTSSARSRNRRPSLR